MTARTPVYEVLALRFGVHADRLAYENFLVRTGPIAPETAMPMDFYLWLVRDEQHLLLVDTGFPPEVAARRGRTILHPPMAGLADLGITPADISDVVITHLHYDHAGHLDRFPAARLHLQAAELRFCTGEAMRYGVVRQPFEPDDVAAAVHRLFAGQLMLHQGAAEIIPGVTVHPVPGHTPGLQVVRVPTERGWVVLASDAAHLWANIRHRSPFPILDNLTAVLAGYHTVEALADGEDHIIPGHDPQVAARFPRLAQAPDWFRLHEPPTPAPRTAHRRDPERSTR